MAEHVIFSGTIVCTEVDKEKGIAHFFPMADQMQSAKDMLEAPLNKFSEGERPGYMYSWKGITGATAWSSDTSEILRQITGVDWKDNIAEDDIENSLARAAVRKTLGEDALENLFCYDDQPVVEGGDSFHLIYLHRNGMAAIVDASSEDALGIAILVPGISGPVIRTVDISLPSMSGAA